MGVIDEDVMLAGMKELKAEQTTQAAQLEQITSGAAGTYELIETITVGAGGATSIAKTAEPDATPYSFRSVLVEFECAAGSAGDLALTAKDGVTTLCATEVLNGVDTGAVYSRARMFIESGLWTAEHNEALSTKGDSYLLRNLGDFVFSADHDALDALEIACSSSIPATSVIKIYGIRATT